MSNAFEILIDLLPAKERAAVDLASLRELLDILATPGIIGFDLETNVSRLYDREVATMQAAHNDGREAVIWVWGMPEVIKLVFSACAASPAELAAHFNIFETEMAMKYGSVVPFKCTYIAARVLRGVVPGNGIDPIFSLKGRVLAEFGEEISKEVRSSDWTQKPDDAMIQYALDDARYARDLWILYEYEMSEDPDQRRGFDIVNNAVPAIAECNLNGLPFDHVAHDKMVVMKQEELGAYALALDVACDGEIENHGSPKQVSQWVSDQVSFEPGCDPFRASMLYGQTTLTSAWKLTASKQLSMDKDYVASILHIIEELYPAVGLYLRTRAMFNKVKKLLEAFGPKLADKIDPDGHLRGSLIPHGARTTRQSCRDPNLQQMPTEDFMRAMFVKAGEDRVIVQADYAQIELVVGCVICNDKAMQDVFGQKQDIHSATAGKIAGIAYEDFDKNNPVHNKLRSGGKPVTFASLYGAQASTVAMNSGLPMAEATQLLADWLDAYPGIKAYRESEPARAHAAGFTQLVSGQKVRVRKDSRGPQLINIRVQGGAASVMYLALTYVFEALRKTNYDAKLALCIHDEILIDCAEEHAIEVAQLLEREMSRALYELFPTVREFRPESAADAAIVPNWAVKDASEYKLETLLEAA